MPLARGEGVHVAPPAQILVEREHVDRSTSKRQCAVATAEGQAGPQGSIIGHEARHLVDAIQCLSVDGPAAELRRQAIREALRLESPESQVDCRESVQDDS